MTGTGEGGGEGEGGGAEANAGVNGDGVRRSTDGSCLMCRELLRWRARSCVCRTTYGSTLHLDEMTSALTDTRAHHARYCDAHSA